MENEIPLSKASLRSGINRERLVRRVQDGEIRGRLVDGRWVIDVASLERFLKAVERRSGPLGRAKITA